MDHAHRKHGLDVSCFPSLTDHIGGMLLKSHHSIGAFLAGFSRNMGMLVGGRFLTGLGCGTANNASWVDPINDNGHRLTRTANRTSPKSPAPTAVGDGWVY